MITSLFLKLLFGLFAIALVVGFLVKTHRGRKFWSQITESVQEVKKMHWPTRPEVSQTTLAVLLMVVVMGIILCSADAILLRAVRWFMTGHWGV